MRGRLLPRELLGPVSSQFPAQSKSPPSKIDSRLEPLAFCRVNSWPLWVDNTSMVGFLAFFPICSLPGYKGREYEHSNLQLDHSHLHAHGSLLRDHVR